METYYKPSGKVGPLSVVYFFLCALIAFPLLGAAYSYAIWYIPFFYLNFLIAIFFGIAIGWVLRKIVIRMGKLRNVPVAFLFSLLSGFIAMYVSWAVWVDLVVNAGEHVGFEKLGAVVSNAKVNEVLNLILNPSALWAIIQEINTFGTWGFKTNPVSGTFLSVIWIIEFLVIVGAGVLTSFSEASKPYCETGKEWFKENVLPPFIYINDLKGMEEQIVKKDVRGFATLKKEENPIMDMSVFTIYESGYEENFLSIANNRSKINDKGEVSYGQEEAINYISINRAQKEFLLNIKEVRQDSQEPQVLNEDAPEMPEDIMPG